MLVGAIQEVFGSKPKLLASNIEAAGYAYSYIATKYDTKNIKYKITSKDALKDYLLISGSQAAAVGKILGVVDFKLIIQLHQQVMKRNFRIKSDHRSS